MLRKGSKLQAVPDPRVGPSSAILLEARKRGETHPRPIMYDVKVERGVVELSGETKGAASGTGSGCTPKFAGAHSRTASAKQQPSLREESLAEPDGC